MTLSRCLTLTAILVGIGLATSACTPGGAATALAPAPTPPAAASNAGSASRPNIVFILTDDLATNLVQYMPHVLAMEREGMTFTNYTVTDSLCCPSRASIFTGDYPHDTHVLSNNPPFGGFSAFVRHGEENRTFATALQRAGYRTAMMGKYLNGYEPMNRVNGSAPYVPPGYSQWNVVGDKGYREFGYHITDNSGLSSYGRAPGDYLTTVLDQRAQNFIGSAATGGHPFMLEVATFAPHAPYVPAPQDVGTFPRLSAPRTAAFNRLPTHPPSWLKHHPPLTTAEKRRINVVFRERVEDVQSVDRMIGDIQRELVSRGLANKTIFVFSSDNGLHMGEHRLTPGKMTAYDTDIRVPLVVTGPGIPAGVRNPAVTQNIDLAPTFEALGHAAIPARTDGRSLLPLLHGKMPRNWPTLALIEHHGPDTNRSDPDYPGRGSGNPPTYAAIRNPRFVYVKYLNGQREYYNLVRDPQEIHNLAPSLSKRRIASLDRQMAALVHCHDATECQRAGYVRAYRTAAPRPGRT